MKAKRKKAKAKRLPVLKVHSPAEVKAAQQAFHEASRELRETLRNGSAADASAAMEAMQKAFARYKAMA